MRMVKIFSKQSLLITVSFLALTVQLNSVSPPSLKQQAVWAIVRLIEKNYLPKMHGANVDEIKEKIDKEILGKLPTDLQQFVKTTYASLNQKGFSILQKCRWRITSRRKLNEEHHSPIKLIVIIPKTNELITVADGIRIGTWNMETKKLIQSFSSTKEPYRCSVAITPDGKKIFVRTMSSPITWNVWNTKSNSLEYAHDKQKNNLASLVITSDGKKIISRNWDKTIEIKEISSNKIVKTFRINHPIISCFPMAVSPDATKIITTFESEINIWDIQSGQLIKIFNFKDTSIFSLVVTKGNKIIVSLSNRKNKILDMQSNTSVDISANIRACSLAVTPDGNKIIVGSSLGELIILETASWGSALLLFAIDQSTTAEQLHAVKNSTLWQEIADKNIKQQLNKQLNIKQNT